MNIFDIAADQPHYVSRFIEATSVSPGGYNTTNMTAEEIANRILTRKIGSRIPNAMSAAHLNEARMRARESNMSTMAAANNMQMSDAMRDLIENILLELQTQAPEGSLMSRLIGERLEAHRNPQTSAAGMVVNLMM